MKKYLLIGYNSGGYKDQEELNFDGTIQKDETHFKITHADGTITVEDNEFIEELLLKERGYHESFSVSQIFEINQDSLFKVLKEKNTNVAQRLIKSGVDVNSKDNEGNTILDIHIKYENDKNFIEYLLDNGAIRGDSSLMQKIVKFFS